MFTNMSKDRNVDNYEIITEKDTKTSDFLSKASITVSVVGAIFVVLNLAHESFNQIICENHYNIPGQFFSDSINNRLFYAGAIILIVILSFFFPYIIRKSEEIKIIFYFCSGSYGIIFGVLNWSVLQNLARNHFQKDLIGEASRWIIEKDICAFVVVIMLSVIVVIGFSTLYNQQREKKKKIKYKIIILLKKYINKFKIILGQNKVFCFLKYFFLIITGGLLLVIPLFGVADRFITTEKDRKQFEIMSYNDHEYFVLSDYNGDALIVEFEIEDGGEYLLKTFEYYLVPRREGKYRYVDTGTPPKVCKSREEFKTKIYSK